MATVVEGANLDDISALLHRESGRSRRQWSDTPITFIKSWMDPGATPLTTSITGSTVVFGNLLDAGVHAWRRLDGRDWPFGRTATPVLMPASVVLTRAVEEFSVLAARIREIAGLTVPEFANLFERARETYYLWLRNGPTREAQARAEAICMALEVLSGQAAHRVHDWLFADDGERFELLVAEDYASFREQARKWISSPRVVSVARAMTMDEVQALADEEPVDAGQRYRAYLASIGGHAVSPVRVSPNFYRDLLVSDEDEDE